MKYGKGKTMSTAADMLEALAAEHEIARKVLEYRQLTKLKGTYVDALPALIRRGTGRIHTTFNQTGAATGRLSSSNPNLQNIPIRTRTRPRDPRGVRSATKAGQLVVADYSQIELRLLAHMSGDPVLVERLPERRRHPHAHGGRGVWRAAADGDAGDAPERQGREFRHRLRSDAVRTCGATWESTARKPRRTSAPISSDTPA